MIALHRVSKWLGRGHTKKLVLDEIDCVFQPKTHYAILGAKGSGKTTLLQLLSGAQVPTTGWIERRAVVSSMAGLVRFGAGLTTPRQLTRRLANLYRADPLTTSHFVENFTKLGNAMDLPTRFLSLASRQKLGIALFYALPCDFYLYERVFGTKLADMKELVQQAYLQRRNESGMIFATSQPRAARLFGGRGGVLYAGKLTLYDTVEEAIDVFEQLPQVQSTVVRERPHEPPLEVDEIDE